MRAFLLLLLLLPATGYAQAQPQPDAREDADGIVLTGTLGWAILGAAGTAASACVAALGHVWRANQAASAAHATQLITLSQRHADELATVRAGYQRALDDKAGAEAASHERHAAELVRLDDRYASSQERFTNAILGRLE